MNFLNDKNYNDVFQKHDLERFISRLASIIDLYDDFYYGKNIEEILEMNDENPDEVICFLDTFTKQEVNKVKKLIIVY